MLKITGLDKLTRDLDQAQRAFKEIDGHLGQVNFKPSDPRSVEGAIQDVDKMVDDRLSAYASNPIVRPMIAAMKKSYRTAIIEKAAAHQTKSISELQDLGVDLVGQTIEPHA
jgi:hypothetical protein